MKTPAVLLFAVRAPAAIVSAGLLVAIAAGVRAEPAKVSLVQRGVAKVRLLLDSGGHLDWCAKTGRVAVDRMGPDGYFDVWLMDPDGSDLVPLTSSMDELPGRHAGNPAWHPSCDYLVIQAQQPDAPRQYDRVAVPGSGIFNDLWLIRADGRRAWKIWTVSGEVSKHAAGTLHAQFSHDGEHLLWAQRIGAGSTNLGNWVLKLADIDVPPQEGKPALSRVKTIVPGGIPTFFESHGFSRDDRQVIFSGSQDVGLEIYTMDLAKRRVRRLTNSPRVWDEHAHFSPDGRQIVWMSSAGLRFRVEPFDLQTEFWLMRADGSAKRRLTYFHQPEHPHYINQEFVVAADIAWSADGKSMIGLVINARPETDQRDTGPVFHITPP